MTESEALAVREIVRRVTGSEDLAHDVIEVMLKRQVRNPLAYGPLLVARWLQATRRVREGIKQARRELYDAETAHLASPTMPRVEAQVDARVVLRGLDQGKARQALMHPCKQRRYEARGLLKARG